MDFGWLLLSLVIVCCLATLGFALALWKWVEACNDGTPEMKAVADPIREGANGFLKTQYTAILKLSIVVALALFFLSFARENLTDEAGNVVASKYLLGVFTLVAFLVGASFSGLCGWIGMAIAVRVNVRVTSAATRSYNEAIQVCLRGGAVPGFLVVTLSVLGLSVLLSVFYAFYPDNFDLVPSMLVGYGFGASFVALFAQLGGGIYTKAADVGADIVGKVEANIPEDDPRNPAVVADLVGDNVGDCAGRGADLFESIAAENLGAMILASYLVANVPDMTTYNKFSFVMFPLYVHIIGLVSSAIGVLIVKTKSGVPDVNDPLLSSQREENQMEEPMAVLKRGYSTTVAISTVLFVLIAYIFLNVEHVSKAWGFFAACGLIGVAVSYSFVLITQYYTDYAFAPVKSIAESSKSGHGVNVIRGIAVGMESTALPTLVIAAAIICAYYLGSYSGVVVTLADGTTSTAAAGLFGTAVATMGMLTSATYVLAMDNFGPIADNSGGISEMSHQPEEVRVITDKLDAVGNTTKALTKGFAIGSASLAAFLLFSAYLDVVKLQSAAINLAKPEIFIGGLIGAMLVMLFSAFAMAAVGTSAQAVVDEVRRQFTEYPGIMARTQLPDYTRCVAIVTESALSQMVKPGLLVVCTPVATGLLFRLIGLATGSKTLGAEVAAGLLMIGTIVGIMMALFLNNAGGAWDNAKKFIELGNYGGKGSDAHKAAVTGDTVGDPFKDTAGPSIHVLIKLLATVTLVLGPLFVNS